MVRERSDSCVVHFPILRDYDMTYWYLKGRRDQNTAVSSSLEESDIKKVQMSLSISSAEMFSILY